MNADPRHAPEQPEASDVTDETETFASADEEESQEFLAPTWDTQ
jgi:hypothetical protein